MEKQSQKNKKEKMENVNEEIVKEGLDKKETEKTEKIKEVKKKETKKVEQKDKAIANGFSMRISPKNSKYICKAIRGKGIDEAVKFLEQVVLKKKAVPMNGAEIPHRKGKGMMSGRYPVNAAIEIMHLLKQLKANAQVSGIEMPIITLAIANKAQLPHKKEGRRGKRAHVYIEAKEKTKLKMEKD